MLKHAKVLDILNKANAKAQFSFERILSEQAKIGMAEVLPGSVAPAVKLEGLRDMRDTLKIIQGDDGRMPAGPAVAVAVNVDLRRRMEDSPLDLGIPGLPPIPAISAKTDAPGLAEKATDDKP
jgi:hypothetical protein